MNTIGRIFIVLILVLSLMFMAFSVVIYSTQNNWKSEAKKFENELKGARTRESKIEQERDEVKNALQKEISARQDRINELATKQEELVAENIVLKEDKTKLEQTKDENIAAVRLVNETCATLRTENEGLRVDLRTAQEKWAELYKEFVAQTDEAHENAIRLSMLRSIAAQMADDYRKALEVLKKNNWVPEPAAYSDIPPKEIEGLVTVIGQGRLVEISVGSDSGIIKGHQLDVVRQLEDGRAMYIGKIEVRETHPDKAAAEVMPQYRKGTVQVGDKVVYISTTDFVQK